MGMPLALRMIWAVLSWSSFKKGKVPQIWCQLDRTGQNWKISVRAEVKNNRLSTQKWQFKGPRQCPKKVVKWPAPGCGNCSEDSWDIGCCMQASLRKPSQSWPLRHPALWPMPVNSPSFYSLLAFRRHLLAPVPSLGSPLTTAAWTF